MSGLLYIYTIKFIVLSLKITGLFFPFKNIPVNLGVAAVGSGVVKTGEAVGSAAVSGVNAVGKFTKPFFFGGIFDF